MLFAIQFEMGLRAHWMRIGQLLRVECGRVVLEGRAGGGGAVPDGERAVRGGAGE
jgi:hypothetical protein